MLQRSRSHSQRQILSLCLALARRAAGLRSCAALLVLSAMLPVLGATLAGVAWAQESPLEREVADHLVHGRTDAASQLFAQTAADRGFAATWAQTPWKGAWSPGEAVLLAKLRMRLGDYAAARQLLKPLTEGKKPQLEAALLLAEVERQSGRAESRTQLLLRTSAAWPASTRAAVALGRQMVELGKVVEARKLMDLLADWYQGGQVHAPDELAAVAESLLLNGYPKDALSVLRAAEEDAVEPDDVTVVELALGELYLAKYNYRDADTALRKVLAVDPGHPRALLAMAAIDLASDSDVARARERTDQVRQENPNLLEALVMRGEVALQDEDWPTAKEMVRRGLAQRPDALEVRYLQGALAKLTDDTAAWLEAEQAVRKINRDNGQFYLEAAEHLAVGHRYTEAHKLLETAIQRDGELWRAHAAMGMAYARVADDVRAQKSLETAFAGDPFDVRTANQLNILYDDVLKHMVLIPGRSVDLRVHKRERKGLEASLAPFLQDAVDRLAKNYGFVPAKPLQVEIFPDVQAFSVRTVGLPRLGAHAVCFGHLVTSRSPAAEPFNWKMVLYHELSHVFHIQATDGRVPRWLTEGLAMMEAAWLDPRYKQHDDRRAWDRLQDGKLAKLEKFNLAFSQARSMQDILDAYDQAMREVDFLAQRYGADKVRKLALGHQPGKTTAGLMHEIFGKEPAQLDEEFAQWLRQDLGRFERDFRPTADQIGARLGLTEGRDKLPTQRDAVRAALAEGVLALRERQDPRPALARAVAAGKTAGLAADAWRDVCAAQALRLDLELRAGNKKTAGEVAGWLTTQADGRCDGVTARLVLASLATAAGDPDAAAGHLAAARQIDPHDAGLLERWRTAAELALPAALGAGDDSARSWFRALAHAKTAELLEQLRWLAAADMHGTKAVEALGELAWPLAQSATDTALRDQAARDLDNSSQWLDERAPATAKGPLWLARARVVSGQAKVAMPLYRAAAERARPDPAAAEIWCEMQKAAAQAGLPAEQAEAARRCKSPDRAAPLPATPAPAGP